MHRDIVSAYGKSRTLFQTFPVDWNSVIEQKVSFTIQYRQESQFQSKKVTYHQIIWIRHEARRLDEIKANSSIVFVIDRVKFQQIFETLHFDQEIHGFRFGIVRKMERDDNIDKLEQVFECFIRIWIGPVNDSLIVFLSDLSRKTSNELVSPATKVVIRSIGLFPLFGKNVVILSSQQFELETFSVLCNRKKKYISTSFFKFTQILVHKIPSASVTVRFSHLACSWSWPERQ